MKRYQVLEFEYKTTKHETVLKRIERKAPAFFELWGETIECMLDDEKDYVTISDSLLADGTYQEPSYFLGVDKQEDMTYVWFIAFDECQIVE